MNLTHFRSITWNAINVKVNVSVPEGIPYKADPYPDSDLQKDATLDLKKKRTLC